MARIRRIHGNDARFREHLGDAPISTYFNVAGDFTYTLVGEHVHFTAAYQSKPPLVKFDVPMDINSIICSYLILNQYCFVEMEFPPLYPFHHPKWTLRRSFGMNGRSIVDCVNQQYVNSWSPAFSIEKDLLCMIAQLPWV
jgi:hypothetical protein